MVFLSVNQLKDFIHSYNVKAYYADGSTSGNYNVNAPAQNKSMKGFSKVLLVPQTTNHRIVALDPYSGDLITDDFYTFSSGTVIDIDVNTSGEIVFSDQIGDVLLKHIAMADSHFVFAPAGGVDNTIMDNIRGFWIDSLDNYYVTAASGTNANSIVTFNSLGTYTGTFATQGQVQSPFDIFFRSNDVLISEINANAVKRYDLTGVFIDNFLTGVNFPQQIFEDFNENIITANFSGTPGVVIQQSDGTLIKNLNSTSSNRGVYMLGNGNLLVSNSSGVHEIDTLNDVVIRTIVSGISSRYIKEVKVADIVWPQIALTPDTLTELCNDSVLLRLTSHPLAEYEWLHDSASVAVDVDSLWASVPGNYQAVVGYKGVWSDTLQVDLISDFEIVDVTVTGNILSVPDIYLGYQWYKDDTIIPGADTHEYVATQNGSYKCEITFSPTCSGFSNEENLINVGKNMSNLDISVLVMPNPFSSEINLSIENFSFGKGELIITDITGREVFYKSLDTSNKHHNETINLSSLSEGIYFARVHLDSKMIYVTKIIKTK